MKNSTYSPRWAGMIKRYHAKPTLRTQSVGEHTWQVMLIYVQHFGIPSKKIWYYLLHHDIAEIGTGDVPFEAKRRFPSLKSALNKIEDNIMRDFSIVDFNLTEQEKLRVKWADLWEMKLFAQEEVALGNSYANDIIHNIDEALALLGEVT